MEISKDEFRWHFTTTLPNGQKCVLSVDKKFFPKYTRKPKGITREMIIRLAARAMRNSKVKGKLCWVISLCKSEFRLLYNIHSDDGIIHMQLFLDD